MKMTWFTQTNLTAKEADELIERYRARGAKVERTLAADPRLFAVSVLLPESRKPPRADRRFENRVWG